MICPRCQADSVSFWRVWLLNFRQQVSCVDCSGELQIVLPGRIAIGTVVLLIAAGAAYTSPGSRGLGLALLLLTIVANFVLTHHFVRLQPRDIKKQSDSD